MRLTYTSLGRNDTSVRDVEPWRVFSTLGNWYLSGFCRSAQGERVFRIDRIREARVTGDRFRPPAALPPAAVRYAPGADDVAAVIRLRGGARWVAEYYPVEELSVESAETVVRFSAPDAAVTARLLVRLGGEAELVEGAEVAEAAAGLRSRIRRRYDVASP